MGTLKNITLMVLDERDESVWNLIPWLMFNLWKVKVIARNLLQHS